MACLVGSKRMGRRWGWSSRERPWAEAGLMAAQMNPDHAVIYFAEAVD